MSSSKREKIERSIFSGSRLWERGGYCWMVSLWLLLHIYPSFKLTKDLFDDNDLFYLASVSWRFFFIIIITLFSRCCLFIVHKCMNGASFSSLLLSLFISTRISTQQCIILTIGPLGVPSSGPFLRTKMVVSDCLYC